MIDVFDYAGQICHAMPRGILLTTRAGEQINTMTIGWGTLGIEWGKPVFIAFVRESRHTRLLLDEGMEFTVNVPLEGPRPDITGFCGRKSGREVDKIHDLGLTLEDPAEISVPGIRELPLTLECRVLYRQEQDLAAIPGDILEKYYPQTAADSVATRSRDRHIAYYAEIVNAYLITE